MKSLKFVTAFVAALLGSLILFHTFTVFADSSSAEDQLQFANKWIDQAIVDVNHNDLTKAKQSFDSFKSNWFSIEDGIKVKSRAIYKEIEEMMGKTEFAFLQEPVQTDRLLIALQNQKETNEKFIQGNYEPGSGSASESVGSVGTLIGLLDEAQTKLEAGDIEAAREAVDEFRNSWLDIEGIVLTQSQKAYGDAERDMVLAYAYLTDNPPEVEQAKQTVASMKSYLEPLAAKTSYSLIDATTIILREGMEALLVVLALLAFLKKSGHDDKKPWIWGGVLSGIGVSVVLGVIVQVLFTSGAFGTNNFLIMGFTGIFAAVMLLYMTYWLHSKASMTQWNHYIRSRSTSALAKGSLWSLALLAFLAIFREGTETVLFLIGMASSISLINLLAGIGIGVGILLIISYVVLRFGVKIPVRPFFLISSVLVFYLCFKFAGMGVHGLQLAGLLPATEVSFIQTIDVLAVYPTWEGLAPQIVLIVAACFIVIWNQIKDLRLRQAITDK